MIIAAQISTMFWRCRKSLPIAAFPLRFDKVYRLTNDHLKTYPRDN